MDGHRNLLCAVALVALTVAGCLGGPADPAASGSEGPTLADLRRCDLTYPDGEPVPCRSQVRTLDPGEGTLGPTWRCRARASSDAVTAEVWVDTITDRVALRYRLSDLRGPAGAIAATETQGGSLEGYEWSLREGSGTVLLRDAPRDGTLRVRFHRTAVRTSTAALEDGSLRTVWTRHAGHLWPHQRLETGDGSYRFQALALVDGVPRMADAHLAGTDYELRFDHERVAPTVRLDYRGPATGCRV